MSTNKCRCANCGDIALCVADRPCQVCGSPNIEPFPDPVSPEAYLMHAPLVYKFSKDLAKTARQGNEEAWKQLAQRYTEELLRQARNIPADGKYASKFQRELYEIVTRAAERGCSNSWVISSFLSIWLEALAYDSGVDDAIHDEILKWLLSQYSDRDTSTELKLVIHNREPYPGLFTDELVKNIREVSTDRRDERFLPRLTEDFITSTGGQANWESAAQPGVFYATLPFNYHINITEAAWTLLQNGMKLVPIVLLLTRMELPQYAEVVGVAEVVRTMLSNIKKLHKHNGETCVYHAIGRACKRLGKYPSIEEIMNELGPYCSHFAKCKYFQLETKANGDTVCKCSITRDEAKAIIDFLKDKKIVKQVAADEWWLSF